MHGKRSGGFLLSNSVTLPRHSGANCPIGSSGCSHIRYPHPQRRVLSLRNRLSKSCDKSTIEILNTVFWRLATLAFRLPSPQQSLTSEFGMGSGVTSAMNHQNTMFKFLMLKISNETPAYKIRCLSRSQRKALWYWDDLCDESPELNTQSIHLY